MKASGQFSKIAARPCFGWAAAILCALVAISAIPASAAVVGPKAPDPAIRLSLESLGFQAPPARIIALGGTLLTLHYVDDTHLLFTYYTRALMPRLADAQPEDDDCIVAALLVELPSGKVLARTQWRLHDRDPYLWSIGHGQFLLRVRTRLVVLNPLGNLERGDAFHEEVFGDFRRRIGYVTVSPGGDLLTVETVPPPKPKLVGGAASAAALAATQGTDKPKDAESHKPEVQILFYRLNVEKSDGQPDRLVRHNAGGLLATNLINVPASAEGFVGVAKERNAVYDFDFFTHAGQKTELAAFDTTCTPHPYFVSRSEFVALGCHGAADKPELGGFNLKGEHAWIEVLSGDHFGPMIMGAPAAGRFAFSRITLSGSFIDPQNIVPEEMTGQEVSVRQNYDGRLLLKLQASPIQRAGQNFDMSPNGMELAIIRSGNIEIYRLPPLTGKDVQQMKLAAAMEPARNDARIMLNGVPIKPGESASAAPGGSQAQSASGVGASAGVDLNPGGAPPANSAATSTAGPPTAATPAAPSESPQPVGDAPQEHRKPPTLYDADHPKKPSD